MLQYNITERTNCLTNIIIYKILLFIILRTYNILGFYTRSIILPMCLISFYNITIVDIYLINNKCLCSNIIHNIFVFTV